ncbi:MAG: alpha/beta hydrolase [Burkholderiaceae bacterium]|jgi:pimeloyl-ACP methyl ester carboxylesterase|nr:alpha/beta hydrolase [Burkholderiaceae bacterium]
MHLIHDIVPAAQPHTLLADDPALAPAALAALDRALHRAAVDHSADRADATAAWHLTDLDHAAHCTAQARFSHTRGLRLLRLAFRAAGAVSTAAQAQLGYRVLSTPPRFARPLREQRALAAAQPFAVPFRDRTLRAWRWGCGPTVLLAHCWGGRGSQMAEFAQALLPHGFSAVVFDAPGHGDSPGRRTDMIEMAESIAAVARACGPLHGVIGHSLGGAASLLALRDCGLAAPRVVSIGAFSHCIWFTEAFGRLVGMSPAAVAGMRALLSRRYSHRIDWSRLGITEAIRAADAHTRTLLVHDRDDREVPYAHALALQRARPQAALLTTRGLGHRRVLRDAEVILRATAFVRG